MISSYMSGASSDLIELTAGENAKAVSRNLARSDQTQSEGKEQGDRQQLQPARGHRPARPAGGGGAGALPPERTVERQVL